MIQAGADVARAMRRHLVFLAALVAVVAALAVRDAQAVERCAGGLQTNVCLEANPNCPAASAPFGVSPGTWPAFQRNVQHTGQSAFAGPSCSHVAWSTKLLGRILSAPVLAPGNPGESETLFVPVGKAPICAVDPANGTIRWCDTDKQGKRADRSSPVIGNGTSAFIGTRDNDMWAINIPPLGSVNATVAWQQFVCTDGDITVPPIIGKDGLIYMASDSLGAGTLIAMCPGPTRQPKWCINPVGGGIRNASPALNAAGTQLYVTIGGGTLGAYNPQTGVKLWEAVLEPKTSIGRTANFAPVVDPGSGRIYVGLKQGLWAVDPPTSPGGAPTITLFLDTRATREHLEAPPALDLVHGRVVVGASRGLASTLYSLSTAGQVLWKRSDLGKGKFQNNPPVIDSGGRIYLTLGTSLIALQQNGSDLWRSQFTSRFPASPILANGTLYVGTTDGTMYSIGGCAP
jgi:outer membrane protein assembly factor BamB